MKKIWLLSADGQNKYLSLIPHTLIGYWDENFAGEPMSPNWQPPPIEIIGKSKKLGDFVGWMLRAPIVSERAMKVLSSIVGESVQFLPFHAIRGKPYYALNVLCVEDLLDREQSELSVTADGRIINVYKYAFRSHGEVELPPIFKLSQPMSHVFVTEAFAKAIVENKLTGACFQDPAQSSIELLAKGKELNTYPSVL